VHPAWLLRAEVVLHHIVGQVPANLQAFPFSFLFNALRWR
jgi:hypothetical protein